MAAAMLLSRSHGEGPMVPEPESVRNGGARSGHEAIESFRAAQSRLLRRHAVDAESRYVDVPAISGAAHVLVAGPESGVPVVMVPGFADPAALWAPLMGELAGETVGGTAGETAGETVGGTDSYRLYAVDRPCFGLSGCAEQSAENFRTLATDFLEQVLDALGLDRPRFVANSIGSLWTFWMALDRPDRVRAMVHVGCPATILGTSAPLPMRLLSIRPLGRLILRLSPTTPESARDFAEMVGEDLTGLDAMTDLLVATQSLPEMERRIPEVVSSVVRLRGPRPEVELTGDELAAIAQPVCLIWGENDPFGSPDVGREAARLIPNAQLHVVPDGGHVPWVTWPGRVGAVARPFLAEAS